MGKPRTSVEPTLQAVYTEAITRALEAAGVEPTEVLRDAHVNRVRSTDPLLRVSESDINALFERAVAATGDPYFGLRVVEHILPGMLHALGYALLASATLEDFCHRIARYWPMVAQGSDFYVAVAGGELTLEAVSPDEGPCHETRDVWTALIVRLMRMVHQGDVNPLLVKWPRPVPPGGESPYRDYFGCELVFESTSHILHFDLGLMREPLPGASPELAQYNDQIVLSYLEKLDSSDIVNRVRTEIVSGLSADAFGRTAVARRLGMSASTLQARLARAGVSFQMMLDETRRGLALCYISQSHLSITEIAYMLGFSDLSNFIRAFRRWTGKSPTKFRRED